MSWVLNLEAKSYFEMWYNERMPCMFSHSTEKCCKIWKQSIKQMLDVLLKHKPQRNTRLQDISKMTVSHLECQSLNKNIKECLFFRSTSPIFPPKSLECIIFINKIVLINVALLMKKIQDFSINSKKIGFLYYNFFMPSCRTYFNLFMIKIWINLNKYWYSRWFLFNKTM
jgi:hypothetical protein